MGRDPGEPWLPVVQAFVQAYELGEAVTSKAVSVAVPAPGGLAVGGSQGPTLLLCSPHPDDESLTGALPLRLLREHGATVVNLAITLGSNRERQAARRQELMAACALLGFTCRQLAPPAGFDVKAGPHGQGWQAVVHGVADLIAELIPDLIFFPHAGDHHPAHRATNQLLAAALSLASKGREQALRAVETEYWRPMARPNLLVGLLPEDVARLMAAVSCHRGEIARNPYHLTLPARLLDNVRRGAEVVAGTQGGERPPFRFGELYRLSRWHHGDCHDVAVSQGWLAPGQGCLGVLSD